MNSQQNKSEQPEENIIVFDSYDTTLKANLVKTKLDAYGIPCFLSDENFNGLYPFQNELFPGVRLHIFEKDRERVKEIIAEVTLFEPELLQCPKCGSVNIQERQQEKGLFSELTDSILSGLFLTPKKKFKCLECKQEFDALQDNIKSSTP
jgi:Putative prokaryotic signal transducing protein